MDMYKLRASALLSATTARELCRLTQFQWVELAWMIDSPKYDHYAIPKKRGGARHIFAPEWRLKLLQRRLNVFLQAYYLAVRPAEAHGFVVVPREPGRRCNIVENAAVHVGRKHVVNIDLKDFFPSIAAWRIKELFDSPLFNFDEPVAVALALLTTYRGVLPTGAPTSPVLSNFVCMPLDDDLRVFCREQGLLYTRYADDLTFSADELISGEMIDGIIDIIRDNGFEINPRKLRAQASNRRQSVTGLTVNEKVNVDRRLLKKIRAMLHDLTINGLDVATKRHFGPRATARFREQFLYRLEGYINFVGQVRGTGDPIYLKFKSEFRNKQIRR